MPASTPTYIDSEVDLVINDVPSEEVLRQMEQDSLLQPNQYYQTPDVSVNALPVVANPEGAAASTLTKIQIDGVNYNIPNPSSGTIGFVTLSETTGVLDSTTLNSLLNNKSNKIIFSDRIYYLTLVDNSNHLWKYTSKDIQADDNTILNVVSLDTQSGAYAITNVMDKAIADHLANATIHVTAADKENWNNKVSARVQIDSQDSSQYILILEN